MEKDNKEQKKEYEAPIAQVISFEDEIMAEVTGAWYHIG